MIRQWDPFAELNRIQQHLAQRNAENDRVMRPPVDIREEEKAFVVHAELPGTKAEDVQVEVERGVLTIRGERRFTSDETTQKQYRRVERYYGAFERSFSLPSEVDADSVEAKLENGVLEVRVPKRAAPSPKRVTVSAS
jgi:HSP20 family protein